MIKLPKIEAHMDRSRSTLYCLVLSAMIAAAPAYESAWAKDGNSGSGSSGSGSSGSGSSGSGSSGNSGSGGSGSGGNSGKGGGNSGKGDSGEGSAAGGFTVGSTVSRLKNPNMRSSTLDTRRRAKKKRVLSASELQADFQHAQLALKEAELNFNRALADPKADLRKLEQAIRNAELALSTAGARLAVAAAGK